MSQHIYTQCIAAYHLTLALLEKSALDPATLRKRRPGKMKQMSEPVVAPVSPRTVSTADKVNKN